MSGTGRGVGRGRGRRKPEDIPQPDQAAMDKIKQERASLAIQTTPTPEQTDSTPDADSAKTTAGEGKPAPLVSELKEALQGGVQLAGVNYGTSDATITAMNKLNPSAPIFTPSLITPPTSTTPTVPHPIYTKHSIPATTSSSSTSSKLNPSSKEFVPSTEFSSAGNMPPGINGNPDLYGNGDMIPEEDFDNYLDVKTVVRGFERAAPTEAKDQSSYPILNGAAEMLIKVYNYPASFDELGKNFQSTLSNWAPSESTLINLAEMLVHWGVNIPDLRYAACRVSFLISGMKGAENFRSYLLKRLQYWHNKCYAKEALNTDTDKYNFANYSGFCAEIFSKFTVVGKPIDVLRTYIFKYVEKLLSLGEEYYIREACNILKLTGNTLVSSAHYDMAEMTKITETLKKLTGDGNLSSTCISLIMQVLELRGAHWSSPASPINPLPLDSKKKATHGLNTDAAPFVPSDTFASETFYGMPVTQQPVTCASEWDDFVGEDHLVEGCEENVVENEDEFDGLDPDIELEMEAFIEEIEEHLMLQDFDPELHQD